MPSNRVARRNRFMLNSGFFVAVFVFTAYVLWPDTAGDSRDSAGAGPTPLSADTATEPTLASAGASSDRGPRLTKSRAPDVTSLQAAESSADVGSPSSTDYPALRPIEVRPNAPVEVLGSDSPTTTRPAIVEAMAPVALPTSEELAKGLEAKEQGQLIEARNRLNRVVDGSDSPYEVRTARAALAELAQETLFSRTVISGDPLVDSHTVKSGDTLGGIADRLNITDDLLAEINHIRNKNMIRLGQRLKTIEGPIHARVSKANHEIHLYVQDTYVKTYRVALGLGGSTPTGKWNVKDKLENPGWTDPRTGERWHPDDPDNPIGEFWIGLEGVEGNAVGQLGYGIHGTIEPETIGQDVSLGCVRLAAAEIADVYKMLVPGRSTVIIEDE